MSITSEPRSTQVSPNVLIVDDHDLVATSLALYLRSRGLHARRHAARSRDGILTATATLAPGVVLLDLDLGRGPDGATIDGTTFIEGLCRNGWRVVVLTTTEDPAAMGRALHAGALACVPKTASLPVLMTTIRRAVQGTEVMHPDRRRHLIELHLRREAQTRAVDRLLAKLTDRERAVLERLAQGHRAQSIAAEFHVSLTTIRSQIKSVLSKLKVSSQLEAVALLNEHRRGGSGA
jgi:DNA-binding NarL/FixJ family response regulator